jgi:hypothetical protein
MRMGDTPSPLFAQVFILKDFLCGARPRCKRASRTKGEYVRPSDTGLGWLSPDEGDAG